MIFPFLRIVQGVIPTHLSHWKKPVFFFIPSSLKFYILEDFSFNNHKNCSAPYVKFMIDPPIRSLSIPYFILIKERIGSIAFSDDFRGDIFLVFITPKDDRRVKRHFQMRDTDNFHRIKVFGNGESDLRRFSLTSPSSRGAGQAAARRCLSTSGSRDAGFLSTQTFLRR